MFARITTIILLCILSINFALANQINPKKRDVVDQLLIINQTDNLVSLMTTSLTKQIAAAVAKNRGPLDNNLMLTIHNEVKNAMHEQFVLNNKLNNIFYGLYDTHFSTEQLQSIVDFFNSPAGKQLRKKTGEITVKSQEQAKAHARTVGPIVQQRLLKILDNIDKDLKQLEANNKDK